MNITFIIDNNYSIYLYVAIKSILMNANKEDEFCFWIMSPDIQSNVKNEIDILQTIHKFKIKYITIDAEDELKYYKPWAMYNSKLAYYRIYAPKVLVKYGVERYLYLDADIIAKGSLNELYNYDLNGFAVGCCASPITKEEKEVVIPRLNLSQNHNYLYSGLILVDVKKYVYENIYEKSCEIAKIWGDNLYWPDMDLLNLTLDCNHYCPLPPKYSINPGFHRYKEVESWGLEKETVLKGYAGIYAEKDILEAYYHPIIWQIAGIAKPKYACSRNDVKYEFYHYTKVSIFEKQAKKWLPLYCLVNNIKEFIFKIDNENNRTKIRILGIKFSFKTKIAPVCKNLKIRVVVERE